MTPFLSLGVGSCLLAEGDDLDQVTKFEQWIWVVMCNLMQLPRGKGTSVTPRYVYLVLTVEISGKWRGEWDKAP